MLYKLIEYLYWFLGKQSDNITPKRYRCVSTIFEILTDSHAYTLCITTNNKLFNYIHLFPEGEDIGVKTLNESSHIYSVDSSRYISGYRLSDDIFLYIHKDIKYNKVSLLSLTTIDTYDSREMVEIVVGTKKLI